MILYATGLSVFSALAALVATPWVVARLPADYFDHERRVTWRQSGGEPKTALLLGLVKNALGALIVVLGVILLRERPGRPRLLGALATVLGVALIARFGG